MIMPFLDSQVLSWAAKIRHMVQLQLLAATVFRFSYFPCACCVYSYVEFDTRHLKGANVFSSVIFFFFFVAML